jgi:hypothetical protein
MTHFPQNTRETPTDPAISNEQSTRGHPHEGENEYNGSNNTY